jgi:site-specific DNA recombinase
MKNRSALTGMQRFAKTSTKISWRIGNNIVIYTRVSSYEQAMLNTSLESQRKSCQEFAEHRGLAVKMIFGGTYESAKSDERKEFIRMLDYVKKDKTISAILVYSYERFSRSENAGALTRTLESLGVKVLSVFQDVDVTTPSGKLQQNIFYLFGNYDNELRKDKVVKGMVENLRQGYWVSATPFGYTNAKPKHKAREHVYEINRDGELLKLAYKWKAEGNLNNLEIVKKLKKLGSKIEYKSFVRIISNPFYCGYITHSLIPGEVYKGKHVPLVSEELFNHANRILAQNPHKGISKKFKIGELPLKSFAKDEVSLSPFTGYVQKGIYYYKTREKGTAVNVRAEHLNSLFEQELCKLEFKQAYERKLADMIAEQLQLKLADKEKEQSVLKRKLTETLDKLEKLEWRFVNGELDKALFEKYRDKFEAEVGQLTQDLGNRPISSSNLEKAIKKGLQIAQNSRQLWISSDYDDKQKLQYLIYPEGILYNKQKDRVRTPRINSLFTSIIGAAKVLEENKNGSLLKKSRHSHLVVPTGIEPVSKV